MKRIIITGASSGIGAEVARDLGRRGYVVGLIARRHAPMEALVADIKAMGGTAACVAADVADEAAMLRAVETLEEQLGPTDVFVANAGMEGRFHHADIQMARIRKTFDVNVFGVIHGVQAVLPGMLARSSGHLVVVSSVAANRGLPKSAPYSASKAAISTFWEGLRLDLRGTGVTCTTVHPGFVATPMTEGAPFPLPFLIDAATAARHLVHAIEQRPSIYTFPWQMRWVERVLRRVPNWAFDRLLSGRRER